MTIGQQTNTLMTKAAFLTGLTDVGTEILEIFPDLGYCEELDREICLKSMPMGGKDGDTIVTKVDGSQAVCIMRAISNPTADSDIQTMYISLGLLIPPGTNPVPYRNILTKVTDTCKEKGILDKNTLARIVPHLFHVLNRSGDVNKLLSGR